MYTHTHKTSNKCVSQQKEMKVILNAAKYINKIN